MNLQNLSVNQLIKRMENAPDFGYDDEEAEMTRRGIFYKWSKNNKIVLKQAI